jgi:hypothetical protein
MLRSRPAPPLATLAALLAVAPLPAAAEGGARARLRYERDAAAARCPDEAGLRRGVAERLGYDPFSAGAERTVFARITRRDGEIRARVELRTATGTVLGERELSSEREDCGELGAAVELAIAVAVDPITSLRSEPRPARPVRVALVGGVIGAFGALPDASAGGFLGAGLRRGVASLELELAAAAPAGAAAGPGSVSAWLLLASLAPCVNGGPLSGCVVVAGGFHRATGHDLAAARDATLPHLALGARAALELPLRGPAFVRLHADLLVPVVRAKLEVSGHEVWSGGAVEATVGGGVGVRFR